jgi:murein DD-endopeptidase MepM/ murein hydrolase activator NlpD
MASRRAVVALPLAALALLTVLPLLAAGTGATAPSPELTWAAAGIPSRMLQAYRAATGTCAGLRWELLAGIGWVESRHATAGGASVNDRTGGVAPAILGPPLDGSAGRRALPVGEWADRWGLTGPWQQALGPMQFLPGTFASHAVDGDGDGRTDPHDVDDAVATAAAFLCDGNQSLGDERRALLRYNASSAYADEVLEYAERLEHAPSLLCPVAGPTSFSDTWGAPRSGGRRHRGVDMFAARGTPVVAPADGNVELGSNHLGGLVFRLWGDDGTFFYGAHLDRQASVSGHVTAGTILGYVGTSGNAATTPPHLHFEIHLPGPDHRRVAVNPTAAVEGACAAHRVGVVLEGHD